MKTKFIYLSLILFIATSCNYNKSFKADLVSGITLKGSGLSCDNVYISTSGTKITRNTFVYGEKFLINFDGITGFKKDKENAVFPGMSINVINDKGDTVFSVADLYESYNDKGFNYSPLLLQSELIVADPMHSNQKYSLIVKIWDKKSDAVFKTKYEFNIIPNDFISTKKTSKVKYNEIYFFSTDDKSVVLYDKIKTNQTIYWIFEGLDGYAINNERIDIGFSLIAIDAVGDTVMNYPDLYAKTDIDAKEFNEQLYTWIKFTGDVFNNPITCTSVIWDKNSDEKLTSVAKINVEN